MMVLLYDLGLRCYYLAIWVASFFNSKAAQWIEGRQSAKQHILEQLDKDRPVVWVHCSSLGEFEQGRPIIEQIKRQFPTYQVLLTFFSPSGYEIRKDYDAADAVAYLPVDSRENARWLVQEVSIQLAIFVKYDLWYHYMNILQQKKIPSILVAALFRPNQFYFKWYGAFMLNKIKGLSTIYVQNTSVKAILEKQDVTQVVTAGDPRVDRVFTIRQKATKYPLIESFIGNHDVLIAGSTWTEDEAILLPLINGQSKSFKFIIAPHQIEASKLKAIEDGLTCSFIRYSQAEKSQLKDINVLIIDNIGMLASLYQYADVVYIGGAFRTGLHNTLEPATFGVPIIFGPKYHKFIEAKSLVNSGGAFCVTNISELKEIVNRLSNKEERETAGAKSETYILENVGATEKILSDVASYLRID